MEGIIVKRYTDDASYEVKLKSSSRILRKIRVENLADFPSQDNSRKKIAAENRRRKEQQRNKYLIPMSHMDRVKALTDQGYLIEHDPPGVGNCHFLQLFLPDKLSQICDFKFAKQFAKAYPNKVS